MPSWVSQLAGLFLVLVALADISTTVLHPRGSVSVLSTRSMHLVWLLFRHGQRILPARLRRNVLTFAGPVTLATIVLTWLVLLLAGVALLVWPALGEGIQKDQGPTPTDFWAALYYSGYTISTLGYGDIVPQTGAYRLLTITVALLGFSVLTMALTYFISVFSALVRRNSFAQLLHHRSCRSDSPIVLLEALIVGADVSAAMSVLSDLETRLVDLYESHHQYPILHFFHYEEAYYSTAHMLGMMAEVSCLAQTALGPKHEAFSNATAIKSIGSAAPFVLERLADMFLPPARRPSQRPASEVEQRCWRQDLAHATRYLQERRIDVAPLEQALPSYLQKRAEWDRYIVAISEYMNEPLPVDEPEPGDTPPPAGDRN